MKFLSGIGGVVCLLALGVVLGLFVFHPHQPVIVHPPAMVIHDTVTAIQFKEDTIRLTKEIEKVHVDTVYLAKVITAPPETVTVVPETYGVTAVVAGRAAGDTTYAVGFHIKPDSGKYTLNAWEEQWITPGPLNGFVMYGNGSLKMSWQQGFPQSCGFWDDRKHELYGAAGVTLLRALLGK